MFEHLGFFREYFLKGKFIGTIRLEDYDGKIGYYSKVTGVAEENIILESKKVIKKGTEFYYFTYPLSGKIIL